MRNPGTKYYEVFERDLTAETNFDVNTVDENRISLKFIKRILPEAAISGYSLYLAFLFLKSLLSPDGRMFLIGTGEIVQMSLGIAFCYAFIYVLRRGFNSINSLELKALVRRKWQYIFESHVLYMALLFLFRDVNLSGVKLALISSVIFSSILSYLFSAAGQRLRTSKTIPNSGRKIILKKRPYDVATDDRKVQFCDNPNQKADGDRDTSDSKFLTEAAAEKNINRDPDEYSK